MPSKYPVRYVSGSKKEALNIEDMATPHLMNAWRKLGGIIAGSPSTRAAVFVCMEQELLSRGCVYDSEADHWIVPPKPEEATP